LTVSSFKDDNYIVPFIESISRKVNTENNNSKKYESDIAVNSEEQKKIEELKRIDAKVRAHELAHQAAAGELFRGKSFKYIIGPDGKQYAIGGEVSIDITPDPENPEKTIQKMQKARRAALAPADPSTTDLKVAAETLKIEAEARRKLNEEKNSQILDNFSFSSKQALKSYSNASCFQCSSFGLIIDALA
jgi:hypothetical protein